MTEKDSPPDEGLSQVSIWAAELFNLLEQEFEHLKARDVSALEALQAPKTELLEQLSRVAQTLEGTTPKPQVWLDTQDTFYACGQAHLRNVKLMQRQLDAVKGALQALQGDAASNSMDLYDRMGQVSRRSGAWMYRTA